MVGALNKLPIAISGILFFNTPVNSGKICSILVGKQSLWIRVKLSRVHSWLNFNFKLALIAGIVYTKAKNSAAATSKNEIVYAELKEIVQDSKNS